MTLDVVKILILFLLRGFPSGDMGLNYLIIEITSLIMCNDSSNYLLYLIDMWKITTGSTLIEIHLILSGNVFNKIINSGEKMKLSIFVTFFC